MRTCLLWICVLAAACRGETSKSGDKPVGETPGSAAKATKTAGDVPMVPGDDKAPKPTYLGHYDDQFVRENGHWKFLRRQSVSDISPLRK